MHEETQDGPVRDERGVGAARRIQCRAGTSRRGRVRDQGFRHDDGHVVDRVSDLRRATARFPQDRRLAALIADLNAGNARFAEQWATGEVAANREVRKTVRHPSVGPVTVDCDVLTDGDSELKIVIMTAVPGSDDETKLQLTTVLGTHPPRQGEFPR
ncbi:MmyB family transcriptional regulator [Nocardia sp. NPDC004278]